VLSDCSTDRTDEIVMAFPDSRVRLLRMPERGGKTYAQNQGVRHAQGESSSSLMPRLFITRKLCLYLACNYQDPTNSARSVAGINTLILAINRQPGWQRCILELRKTWSRSFSRGWHHHRLLWVHLFRAQVGLHRFGRRCHYDLVQPLWVIQKVTP